LQRESARPKVIVQNGGRYSSCQGKMSLIYIFLVVSLDLDN